MSILPAMESDNVWHQIVTYVKQRLIAEINASRGNNSLLSEKTGISTAHLSNLKNDPNKLPGQEVVRKLSKHWGLSPSELEDIATGSLRSHRLDPATKHAIDRLAKKYPGRWSPEAIAAIRVHLSNLDELPNEQELIMKLDIFAKLLDVAMIQASQLVSNRDSAPPPLPKINKYLRKTRAGGGG